MPHPWKHSSSAEQSDCGDPGRGGLKKHYGCMAGIGQNGLYCLYKLFIYLRQYMRQTLKGFCVLLLACYLLLLSVPVCCGSELRFFTSCLRTWQFVAVFKVHD